MRTVSPALAAHLAGSAHTMATCWRVTRSDGRVYGFTDHDRNIEFEGVVYAASTGVTRSTIEARSGLSVNNLEAQGFLDSEAITDDSLRAGDWDHAEIRVFEVNWADLSMGALRQMRGWLGQVSVEGDSYKAELRGLSAALNTSIVELYSPGCRARLGDERCRMDLTEYTAIGTVFAVTSRREFSSDLPAQTVRLTTSTTGAPPEGYFDGGLLTWLTGPNAGRRAEVKLYAAGGAVQLQLPMGGDITLGDTFTVQTGCQKDRATCFEKFGNVVNFRGDPDLPGLDQILRVGGQ